MRIRALLALGLCSCAYDWTVGPADAGPTSAEESDGPSVQDTSGDETSGRCTSLSNMIELAELSARACQTTDSSACQEFVLDPCGCKLPVTNTKSSGAQNYANLVKEYEDAGCHDKDCSSSCGTPAFLCVPGDLCG
jgi:hypothetical protein